MKLMNLAIFYWVVPGRLWDNFESFFFYLISNLFCSPFQIYLYGGRDDNNVFIVSFRSYHPYTQTWCNLDNAMSSLSMAPDCWIDLQMVGTSQGIYLFSFNGDKRTVSINGIAIPNHRRCIFLRYIPSESTQAKFTVYCGYNGDFDTQIRGSTSSAFTPDSRIYHFGNSKGVVAYVDEDKFPLHKLYECKELAGLTEMYHAVIRVPHHRIVDALAMKYVKSRQK